MLDVQVRDAIAKISGATNLEELRRAEREIDDAPLSQETTVGRMAYAGVRIMLERRAAEMVRALTGIKHSEEE